MNKEIKLIFENQIILMKAWSTRSSLGTAGLGLRDQISKTKNILNPTKQEKKFEESFNEPSQ